MSTSLTQSKDIQSLLDSVAGLDNDKGNARSKKIIRKIVSDLFETIEEFDITEEEFWHAVYFMQAAAPEFGLIAPGLAFDHFLDVYMDAIDKKNGIDIGSGTPRTIEGPLFVENAPVADGHADMREGQEGTRMELSGVIRDRDGNPVSGAMVNIWHASTLGDYSTFHPDLPKFAFRRCIRTGDDGKYAVTSIVPSGYSVPGGGSTETMLANIGRHGSRPAHIHFFVAADGYRHLTTQINLGDDPMLWEDFAFATREELIGDLEDHEDGKSMEFDFTLIESADAEEQTRPIRQRVAG